MRYSISFSVVVAILTLLVGCDFRVDNGNVEKKLDLLEQQLGIPWPKEYTNAYGGSLSSDRGAEVVVRLEVTDTSFSLWQQSITNRLRQNQNSAPKDPKLEKHFPWWNCAEYPPSRVMVYWTDSKPKGHLYVWVVETNNMHTMYIDGRLIGG
jgi:hypothetical protein